MSIYIKVSGKQLDLPVNYNVELVMENPLFVQRRTPFPYTTSFEFPLTVPNLAIFNNPTRVNLASRIWEYSGAVMGSGASVLFYGALIIREISGKLSANFQAVDEMELAKKPMNSLDLGTYTFGEADYAHRTENYPGSGSARYNFTTLFINSSYYGTEVFTSAPISATGTREQRAVDGADTFMNILFGQNNFFNAWAFLGENNPFMKESVVPLDPLIPTHTVMFPQIRLSELFRIVLSLPDEENPFLDSEMSKIVLTSHYHPNMRDDIIIKWRGILVDNEYPSPLSPPEELYFNLGSFQSSVTAAEVLHSAMNMFCMTLFRIQDGPTTRFQLNYNKVLINDESFVDWNSLLGSKLVLAIEPAQDYVYRYSDFSESKPDIDSEFVLPTIQELIDAPVNPDTLEQVYYIQTTGQLILKKQSLFWEDEPLLNQYSYEVKNHGLYGSVATSGYDISVPLGPLPMMPVLNLPDFRNTISPIGPEPLYLPVYSGSRSPDFKPAIMLFQGMTPEGSYGNELGEYPLLSYHNYGPTGVRLGDLSLAWEGVDGLIHNYHYQFKAWVERDRLTGFGDFLFTAPDLKAVDMRKKILLRGKLWWIRKLTVSLSQSVIFLAKGDLIEAPTPGEGLPVDPSDSSDSSGSSTPLPDPTGTCYTISINTEVFDPEADYFNITFRSPGSEGNSTVGYIYLDPVEDGTYLRIYLCSEIVPFYTQSGEVVESVTGVSSSSGGSCSIDGQCIPEL